MAASGRLRISQQLTSRLKKVINEWPADSTRQGRDLGEYLKQSYTKEFKKLLDKDMDKATAAVQSLERLNSNYYHHLYPRNSQLGFTGDVTIDNPWLLSNQTLQDLNTSSVSWWQKVTRTKK